MTSRNLFITSRGAYIKNVATVNAEGDKVTVPVQKYALKVNLDGVPTKTWTTKDPEKHIGADCSVFEKGDVIPWITDDNDEPTGEKFKDTFIVVDGYNDTETFANGVAYESARDAALKSV